MYSTHPWLAFSLQSHAALPYRLLLLALLVIAYKYRCTQHCLALLVIAYKYQCTWLIHGWPLPLQSRAILPYCLLLFSSPGDCIQIPAHPWLALPLQTHATLPYRLLLFISLGDCVPILVYRYSAHPWLALTLQCHASLPYRLLLLNSLGDCVQIPVPGSSMVGSSSPVSCCSSLSPFTV